MREEGKSSEVYWKVPDENLELISSYPSTEKGKRRPTVGDTVRILSDEDNIVPVGTLLRIVEDDGDTYPFAAIYEGTRHVFGIYEVEFVHS